MSNILPYNKRLLPLAKKLRKNLTWGEAKLWKYLKSKQMNNIKFHRQIPILEYIIDFYCKEHKLAIEIDGKSHDEIRYNNDIKRQNELEKLRIKVLRFSEAEVLSNIDNVLISIEYEVEQKIAEASKPLPPSAPSQGKD